MARKGFLTAVFGILLAFSIYADYNYSISSGIFEFPDGWTETCYSGIPEYRNNPNATHEKNKGPLPVGDYYIIAVRESKGPHTIVLEPVFWNNMYGRDNFLIHGDNKTNSASQGCIIMDAFGRKRIAEDFFNGNGQQILHVRR